jgi:hypothetical protein
MGPTASWAEDLYDGLTNEHSSAGVHDNTKVAMLAGTQTFTGNKTFSGTVTLPDDTVTEPKIDFTTFKGQSLTVSNATITTNTSTAISTLDASTVPAGKYLVIATVQFQPSTTTFSGNGGIKVVYGTQIKDAYVSAVSGSPGFAVVSFSCEVDLTGTGSLVLSAIRDSGTNSLSVIGSRSSFTIARIA